MNVYAAIILCFIPLITVLILFKIFETKISIIKELLACAVGLIALIPIEVFQFFVGDYFNKLTAAWFILRALVLYGAIEEGIKCATMFLLPKKNVELKLFYMYSLLAGLFLGCFESVIYLLKSIQNASLHTGEIMLNLIYLRTFTSTVIHTFCSGLLGLFVYSAKNRQIRISPLISAIVIHGLYDAFAVMKFPVNIFSYFVILYLIVKNFMNYQTVKETDTNEK